MPEVRGGPHPQTWKLLSLTPRLEKLLSTTTMSVFGHNLHADCCIVAWKTHADRPRSTHRGD